MNKQKILKGNNLIKYVLFFILAYLTSYYILNKQVDVMEIVKIPLILTILFAIIDMYMPY